MKVKGICCIIVREYVAKRHEGKLRGWPHLQGGTDKTPQRGSVGAVIGNDIVVRLDYMSG